MNHIDNKERKKSFFILMQSFFIKLKSSFLNINSKILPIKSYVKTALSSTIIWSKKSKKNNIIAISVSSILICILLFLCIGIPLLVSENNKNISTSSISINNLFYDGKEINWSSVYGAKAYKIWINNGDEKIAQQTSDKVTYQYDAKNEDFEFLIETVFKEKSKNNPKFSFKFKSLGKVAGLEFSDGILTWTDVEGVDGYELMYNNILIENTVTTNSYTIAETRGYDYQVRAIKQNTESIIYYSIWSNGLYFPPVDIRTKLAEPTDIKFSINSVGGVKLFLLINNISGKTIDYAYLTVKFYNGVDDPVYDEITGQWYKKLEVTGPIKDERSIIINQVIGYYPTCKKIMITEVTLIYADRTSDTGIYGYGVKRN